MIVTLIAICLPLSHSYTFVDPASFEPKLNTYFNNDFIGSSLTALQYQYPEIVQTTSIGSTPYGNEIFAVTITKNVSYWEDHNRPSVKYVGNMHGNEIRGRGLLMKLAYYLATQYGSDSEVQRLVDSTIFHLIPTINPDGFEDAVPTCSGVTGRYTSDGTDMNRDFPNHWVDGTKMKFAEETLLLMEHAKTITPVLGISFHDGALVTNYPWDGKPGLYTGQYAKSPDDDLFISLAKTYSLNHAAMYDVSQQCSGDNFPDGITNGNKWYKVFNGMQDWNYVDNDCFEVTIELGCCKYPSDAKSTFSAVWSDNFNSVFAFTALAHQTIRGTVMTLDGKPLLGASISVEGIDKEVHVRHDNGYYWRPLSPGVYSITATKTGYFPLTRRNIAVTAGEATVVNFILISRNQREFKDSWDQIDGTQSTFRPTWDPRLKDLTLPPTISDPDKSSEDTSDPGGNSTDDEPEDEPDSGAAMTVATLWIQLSLALWLN